MSSLNRRIMKATFSARDRIEIYDNFRQYMLDGATAKVAYERMIISATRRGKKPNDAVALILSECMEKLNNGDNLADSLSEWFPAQERSVIESCDTAGRAEDGFAEAIKIADAIYRIKKPVRSAVVVFVIMFLSFFAILTVMCSLIIPIVLQSIPLERWNLAQQAVYFFYYTTVNYWYVIVAIMITLIYLLVYSLPRWTGEVRVFFDKFPPYSVYKMMHGTTFLTNVDAMLSAGMPLQDVLLRVSKQSESAWLSERVDAVLGGLSNGEKNLGTALDSAGYDFPNEKTIIKLQSLYETSNSEGSLTRFTKRWLDDSIEKIDASAKTIQLFSLLANAISVVGLVAIMYPLIEQMFTF